jgi:predicted component of type VI protein secretion system
MKPHIQIKHSYTPNLFQRISMGAGAHASVADSVQEEVLQLLRHAARSGRPSVDSEAHAWSSVFNYGLPMATFGSTSVSDVDAVIRHLKRMIPVFEPRLNPRSLQITASLSENQHFRESVLFDISAEGKEVSIAYLSFRIAVDFSNGAVRLVRRPNL